jgi:hypothetical protein
VDVYGPSNLILPRLDSRSIRSYTTSSMKRPGSIDKVTLSAPRHLIQQARAKAIAEGTSLSAVFRKFLEKWIKEPPTAKKKISQPKRK